VWCRFARKNYFYPDMPKNFQTSQYDEPIAFNGYTEVEVDGGVDATNAKACVDAGADVLVAGTAVFRHQDGPKGGVAAL